MKFYSKKLLQIIANTSNNLSSFIWHQLPAPWPDSKQYMLYHIQVEVHSSSSLVLCSDLFVKRQRDKLITRRFAQHKTLANLLIAHPVHIIIKGGCIALQLHHLLSRPTIHSYCNSSFFVSSRYCNEHQATNYSTQAFAGICVVDAKGQRFLFWSRSGHRI